MGGWKWIARLLVVLIVFSCLAPAGVASAFEAEVHFAWTYYLALHVGFTRAQAYQIASAAYALDEDPHTGPMEASAGDAVFGAEHPGFFGAGTAHPQIARIWTGYHAFADQNVVRGDCSLVAPEIQAEWERVFRNPALTMVTLPGWIPITPQPRCDAEIDARVEEMRGEVKDRLWALAIEQRNPGPLIHFTQDYYSHFEFDSVRGHALAGHKVDFLANDPDGKGRAATGDAVAILQRFMRSILRKTPKEVDYDRMWEVLGRLAAANPAPAQLNPGNYNPFPSMGPYEVPNTARAIRVLRQAILEDVSAERLPRFPTPERDELPGDFFHFDYDVDGRVGHPGYGVRPFEVTVHEPEVVIESIDGANGKATLRVRYSIAGQPAVMSPEGVYLNPVPVHEMVEISDYRLGQRRTMEHRRNGDYVVEQEIQRPRRDIESGELSWTVLIHVYDAEPVELTVPVRMESRITGLGGADARVGAMDAGAALDLIVVFDLTGSMGSSIESMKRQTVELVRRAAAKSPDFRLGLVTYRDAAESETNPDEPPPFTVTPLQRMSPSALEGAMAGWEARGGGDTAEDAAEAVSKAIEMWEREGETARKPVKLVVLITDAPGKWPDGFGNSRESIAQRAFAVDPAHVYPIIVGSDRDAIADGERLAADTDGRMIRVDSGEDVADAVLSAVDEGFARHVDEVTGGAVGSGGGGGPVRRSGGPGLLPWLVGGFVLFDVLLVALLLARRRTAAAPPPPAPMPAAVQAPRRRISLTLDVTYGGRTRTVGLVEAPATIGRDPACDVVVADPTVSRIHARVSIEGAELVIEQASDTNPIRVDGESRRRAVLQTGQRIRLGDAEIVVR